VLRVAVDLQPGGFDLVAFHVGLGPVALDMAGRHRQAAPGQQAQRLVVQRRRAPGRLHLGQQVGRGAVRLEHGLAFLLPRLNSMQRYCQLWKPLLLAR
jgi:hypothetical protein